MGVSCIIPTKDRCQLVIQAISSAMDQINCKPEIVVVDDGSTDSTVKTVKSMFPEVKILQLSGVGPGLARNAGVAAASNDILMFLDSDDLWFPWHADTLLHVLHRRYLIAYGVTRTIDEVNGGEFMVPSQNEQTEGDCFNQLLKWCFLVPSSVALTREAFDSVNGFDDYSHGEDWTFFIKLSALFPFGFATGRPITLRKLHSESLCCLSDRNQILDLLHKVIQLLENEARAQFNDIAHFMRMQEFVKMRGSQWSTVQDWYIAMKEEEII